MSKKVLSITLISLFSFFFLLLLLKPVNLWTADLGRHIRNGEMILNGQTDVFYKNFYSYTFPDYPFINHHWLTGVVFFLVYETGGFSALSIFFGFISLVTVLLFLDTARMLSNIFIAVATGLILLPLLTYRNEIRPEIFSYLFTGIFLWVLTIFSLKKINKKWLLILPLVSILWVNLHIYFFFGQFILGVFGLNFLVKWIFVKDKTAKNNFLYLLLIGSFSLGALLLNPFGFKNIIHPFNIYGNYGYRVLEEQNLFFLERVIKLPIINYFKLIFGILILSWTYIIFKNFRKLKNISLINLIFTLVFSYLGWIMLRNITFFALFSLVLISANFKNLTEELKKSPSLKFILAIVLGCFLFFLLMLLPAQLQERHFGLGTPENTNASAKFFKENSLKGPIFNNYDIGGYLIFELYPQGKVFVDNRPEVYPKDFLQDELVKSQEDSSKWEALDKKYNFNTIFFYRLDLTPWAQSFLISRVKDPNWAPVYVDQGTIIFIKRTEEN